MMPCQYEILNDLRNNFQMSKRTHVSKTGWICYYRPLQLVSWGDGDSVQVCVPATIPSMYIAGIICWQEKQKTNISNL